MTRNNYLNIKEINNLKWANKLGPSFKKKTRLETILHKTSPVQGNAKALLIKNYSINSAKWTYCSYSFSEIPGAFGVVEWNDSIHGHRGAYFHFPIKPRLSFECVYVRVCCGEGGERGLVLFSPCGTIAEVPMNSLFLYRRLPPQRGWGGPSPPEVHCVHTNRSRHTNTHTVTSLGHCWNYIDISYLLM